MNRRLFQLLVFGACWIGNALVHAESKLLREQGEILFTLQQMGAPLQGRFRSFDARVDYDPSALAATRVSMTIDLGSVSLGVSEFDEEATKRDWLAVRAFPQATFVSSAVKVIAPDQLEVAGRLTIKGASRDMTIPVRLSPSGRNTMATGAFVIKRLDYKVGDGEWKDTSVIANEIQVRFKFVLST
ncbi:YceI family protein [Methylibium sp.]|uniref:YceI family protein n=1 Tax=Methylibium sp. TaxID=2067992 RepID=UPI003D0D75FD